MTSVLLPDLDSARSAECDVPHLFVHVRSWWHSHSAGRPSHDFPSDSPKLRTALRASRAAQRDGRGGGVRHSSGRAGCLFFQQEFQLRQRRLGHRPDHLRLQLLRRRRPRRRSRRWPPRPPVDRREDHHQHRRPQHVPEQHHQLPAGHPGRPVHLVRRLPHAVLRGPGPAQPIDDVWDKIGGTFNDAAKSLSKGLDGKYYFVPLYNYPWVVFYNKSVFAPRATPSPRPGTTSSRWPRR